MWTPALALQISMALSQATAAERDRALVVAPQMQDYPADALAAKVEGKVPILLHIEPGGELHCRVADMHAPTPLLRPSCALVVKRWPFGPELDAAGKPKPTDVALVVDWRIADPLVAPGSDFGGATPISLQSWLRVEDWQRLAARMRPPVAMRVKFEVTKGGRLTNCRPDKDPTGRHLTEIICPAIVQRASLLPASGPDGAPRTSEGSLAILLRKASGSSGSQPSRATSRQPMSRRQKPVGKSSASTAR